ncbi:hypothetical protein CR513_26939, partial [Mucuna pruriens]
MVRWTVELSGFDISFERRGHAKAQALANYTTKLAPVCEAGRNGSYISMGHNEKGSEAKVTLKGLAGIMIEQSLCFKFKANNNQAKYETLLARMKLANRELNQAASFEKFKLLHVEREQNERVDMLSKLASDESYFAQVISAQAENIPASPALPVKPTS